MRAVAILVLLTIVIATGAASASERDRFAYRYHKVPHLLYYPDGKTLMLERGVFFVPVNHQDLDSTLLQLAYYRIPGNRSAMGPPLFLLAGGPGNSYFDDIETARFRDWVDFYRAIGDVVILEQRGASEALPKPVCTVDAGIKLDRTIDLAALKKALASNVLACIDSWQQTGLQLEYFNLVEMARDFDALRKALGYRRFNLKGGSFGSQLGLTIIKQHPESVHRGVFYGIEGPDHSYDIPALANDQFEKVAIEVARNPQLATSIADFVGLARDVFAALEREPARTRIRDPATGDAVEVVVGSTDAQLMIWSQARIKGYRDGIASVPALLHAVAGGDVEELALAKLEFVRNKATVNAMPYMVDCASGISVDRRRRIETYDPAWVLDADIVDYDLHAVCPQLGEYDLGDAFRAAIESKVPVLMISGSLDGFTAPENAEEMIRFFPNGHLLHAYRGDHSGWNVLAEFPEIKRAARSFLAGEPFPSEFPTHIEMPPIDFHFPDGPTQ